MPISYKELEGFFKAERDGIENFPLSKITAFQELYQGRDNVYFFPNAEAVPGDPDGANWNVVYEALPMAIDLLQRKKGILGAIFGPMASGKSTECGKIYRWAQTEALNPVLFKHTFDQRGSQKLLWVQAKEGLTTDIWAHTYGDFTDLLEGENVKLINGSGLLIVDESHFAGKGDPPKANVSALRKLVALAEKSDKVLILAGLDMDFRGHPWENTMPILDVADLFTFVLQGRCIAKGCNRPSFLTERHTRVGSGEHQIRPSHMDEGVIRVGTIFGVDDYVPRCFDHHQVLSPKEAEVFDRQFMD